MRKRHERDERTFPSWCQSLPIVRLDGKTHSTAFSARKMVHRMDWACSGGRCPAPWIAVLVSRTGTLVCRRVHSLEEQQGGLPGVRTRAHRGKRRMDPRIRDLMASPASLHRFQLMVHVFSRVVFGVGGYAHIRVNVRKCRLSGKSKRNPRSCYAQKHSRGGPAEFPVAGPEPLHLLPGSGERWDTVPGRADGQRVRPGCGRSCLQGRLVGPDQGHLRKAGRNPGSRRNVLRQRGADGGLHRPCGPAAVPRDWRNPPGVPGWYTGGVNGNLRGAAAPARRPAGGQRGGGARREAGGQSRLRPVWRPDLRARCNRGQYAVDFRIRRQ